MYAIVCLVGLLIRSFSQAIDQDGIQKNSEVVGTYFLEKLKGVKSEFPDVVGDVRGKGLMIGVELVTDKVSFFFIYTLGLSGFQLSAADQLKVITLANHSRAAIPMNKSELETNTCSWRQARKNACDQVTIGFVFNSDWLKKCNFKPITKTALI